jgi:CHAT domain
VDGGNDVTLAAREWDRLLAQVWAHPGIAGESGPLRASDIRAQAAFGPLVLVNVSELWSGALIVTAGGIDALDLPALTPAAVRARIGHFTAAQAAARALAGHADRAIAGTLAWLWDCVAGPVLDHLGYWERPGGAAPERRLWWVPDGLMSSLPLHAAGHHDEPGDSRTVIDRVVSSYAPSVRALQRSRHAKAPGRRRVQVVDGADDTGFTSHEIELRTPFELAPLAPAGTAVSWPQVLAELATSSTLHLALRAVTDPVRPSASHVVGPGGRRLSLGDIARLSVPAAELAVLTECAVADYAGTPTNLAVPVPHAFHLAGYPSVAAVMYACAPGDRSALTREFYDVISAQAPPAGGRVSAAKAVHAACMRLRDQDPGKGSAWAALGHVGS